MAATSSEPKFSFKLVVHKEKNKVIYAEVNNHFVDTLFSIMTLPMATIVRLLRKRSSEKLKAIGSLNNVYDSLVNLSKNCLSSEENKWIMLNPRSSSYEVCKKLQINIDDTTPMKYFICQDMGCSRRSGARYSTCNLAKCYCGLQMDREVKYEELDDNARDDCDGGVFVSDVTKFIVTDDLRVMPNTLGCSFQLLRDQGITEVNDLGNRTMDMGHDQILDLLQGAVLFKYPLSYMVFPENMVNTTKVTSDFKHVTSNEADTGSKKLTLKVTLQKSTSKLLYAEADSDFVEFVFGFLEIPLGTLIGNLMNCSSPFESLNNLYSSVSNSSIDEYLKSSNAKNMVVKPELEQKYISVNQLFPISVITASKCYCHSYLKDGAYNASVARYPNREGHKDEMFCTLSLKDPRVDGRYLKTSAKFMLTDDLVITSVASTSPFDILCNLKVPLTDVEEHTVNITIEDALNILDASLKSSLALTDSIVKKITETKK
ncbi:uncharacterized protein [Rutidosis leptorrhynchoides]|uniref:uncharacterized protein n=1 Tax=Rutidosis leptorrhynchoides TaxID=125765 RepID=UPI003A99EF3E